MPNNCLFLPDLLRHSLSFTVARSKRPLMMSMLKLTAASVLFQIECPLFADKVMIDGENVNVCTFSGVLSEAGVKQLQSQLGGRTANIGVKKLLGLLDLVAQTQEADRVAKLVTKLEEEMFVSLN